MRCTSIILAEAARGPDLWPRRLLTALLGVSWWLRPGRAMSRAFARIRLPDGGTVDLCPGDIIGRLWSAALRMDDTRISEAHALISLRGDKLKMLPLRGVISDGRAQVEEIVLRPGARVWLARDLALEVEAVELPATTLALEGLTPKAQVLTRSVYSLLSGAPPRLVGGHRPDARAWIWSTGEGWRLRMAGGEGEPLEAGRVLDVGGQEVRAVAVPLRAGAQERTRLSEGRLYPAMRIVARYETVHIHRQGYPPLAISGMRARLLSEMAGFGAPAPWEMGAGRLWRDDVDRAELRQRWDRTLVRLRRMLSRASVRPDLVRSDGQGNIELLLRPGDELLDEG